MNPGLAYIFLYSLFKKKSKQGAVAHEGETPRAQWRRGWRRKLLKIERISATNRSNLAKEGIVNIYDVKKKVEN